MSSIDGSLQDVQPTTAVRNSFLAGDGSQGFAKCGDIEHEPQQH